MTQIPSKRKLSKRECMVLRAYAEGYRADSHALVTKYGNRVRKAVERDKTVRIPASITLTGSPADISIHALRVLTQYHETIEARRARGLSRKQARQIPHANDRRDARQRQADVKAHREKEASERPAERVPTIRVERQSVEEKIDEKVQRAKRREQAKLSDQAELDRIKKLKSTLGKVVLRKGGRT